jgi:hypothetical protein
MVISLLDSFLAALLALLASYDENHVDAKNIIMFHIISRLHIVRRFRFGLNLLEDQFLYKVKAQSALTYGADNRLWMVLSR